MIRKLILVFVFLIVYATSAFAGSPIDNYPYILHDPNLVMAIPFERSVADLSNAGNDITCNTVTPDWLDASVLGSTAYLTSNGTSNDTFRLANTDQSADFPGYIASSFTLIVRMRMDVANGFHAIAGKWATSTDKQWLVYIKTAGSYYPKLCIGDGASEDCDGQDCTWNWSGDLTDVITLCVSYNLADNAVKWYIYNETDDVLECNDTGATSVTMTGSTSTAFDIALLLSSTTYKCDSCYFYELILLNTAWDQAQMASYRAGEYRGHQRKEAKSALPSDDTELANPFSDFDSLDVDDVIYETLAGSGSNLYPIFQFDYLTNYDGKLVHIDYIGQSDVATSSASFYLDMYDFDHDGTGADTAEWDNVGIDSSTNSGTDFSIPYLMSNGSDYLYELQSTAARQKLTFRVHQLVEDTDEVNSDYLDVKYGQYLVTDSSITVTGRAFELVPTHFPFNKIFGDNDDDYIIISWILGEF